MARIRTIKPEIWTSEQFTECSPNARLMFIGLLNFCDDFGVHPASAKRLKMEVFPSDDFRVDDIEGFVSELLHNDLLIEYEVESRYYWRVTGFSKHQKVDQKTGKYPLPSGEVGQSTRRKKTKNIEHSPNTHRTFNERSPEEKEKEKEKEKESKSKRRVDNKHMSADASDADAPKSLNFKKIPLKFHEDIISIMNHWSDVMGITVDPLHPSKINQKRALAISKRLSDGYTREELLNVVTGVSRNPYAMGDNPNSTPYNTVDHIFRDSSFEMHYNRSVTDKTKVKQIQYSVDQEKFDEEVARMEKILNGGDTIDAIPGLRLN